MITYTVHVVTRPTEHERFLAAAKVLRDATVQEEGCIEYSLWTSADGASEVLVVERWTDQAAIDAHGSAPHLAEFRAAVKGAVAVPPVSIRSEGDAPA